MTDCGLTSGGGSADRVERQLNRLRQERAEHLHDHLEGQVKHREDRPFITAASPNVSPKCRCQKKTWAETGREKRTELRGGASGRHLLCRIRAEDPAASFRVHLRISCEVSALRRPQEAGGDAAERRADEGDGFDQVRGLALALVGGIVLRIWVARRERAPRAPCHMFPPPKMSSKLAEAHGNRHELAGNAQEMPEIAPSGA